jgi:signal transduction histidine kinase
MRTPINVLVVEDSEEDTDLLVLELKRGGYEPNCRRVDTADAMVAALAERKWDLVLSDYSMPQFSVSEALSLLQQKGVDVPFVVVSATIIDEQAVMAMKAGAHDFVMKHNLSRLVPAVERELREFGVRRERELLEEQLRQAQKLEGLGLLAGGVAHDFNNLLTGILGNASLVLDLWSPPAEARKMLEDVVRAAERAADLTRQLLAYAGKGRFVVEPLHVSSLVRETSELIRTSISRKVELILDLQEDLAPVEADPSQIQQLVMNLVLNASEAIGDSGGAVFISTGEREISEPVLHPSYVGGELPPGRYVFLEVLDTGCGMDDETKAQIFDPFFSTKFTGRGLGLSAALGIVRSHKGFIRVQSMPGRGSDFEVLFPPAERRPVSEAGPADETPETVDLSGSGLILVVDDEPAVRGAARHTLERYGYTVLEAENGREAVQIFEQHADRISLVLLDVTMPVMSGDEAYHELRRIRPDAKVIISSGYDELDATRRFAGKGAVRFIKKPYTAAKLAEKVKTVLAPHGRHMRGTA